MHTNLSAEITPRLRLHYQPQITADGARLVGLEALLRDERPDGTVTGPQALLQAVESAGAADALDWWILERACRDLARWPGLSVAVNIDARQFQRADFAARLTALLKREGTDPARFELELLEGTIITQFEQAIVTMEALRAFGLRIALDDFGTGYSSLSYLQKLPIDKLKLDRSLVEGVDTPKAAAIVQALAALARALDLTVVAEGVETDAQAAFLRACGCDLLQGHLFSPAVAADTIDRYVAQGWPECALNPA